VAGDQRPAGGSVDTRKIRNAGKGFTPVFHKKILKEQDISREGDTLSESSSLSVTPGMVMKYYFFCVHSFRGTENAGEMP